MARDIFGFKRISEKGPLSFSEETEDEYSIEEIETFLLEIVKEENIDPNNPTDNERKMMIGELGEYMFDYSETVSFLPLPVPKPEAFQECMRSSWANEWEEGVRDVTTELASPVESIMIKANGCQGMVNSDSVFSAQLIYGEGPQRRNCVGCKLAQRMMALRSNTE